MSKKSYCRPDSLIRDVLPGRVFAKLPVPHEHPGVTDSAFDDPEQLIVRFARRMKRKDRRSGIESVFGLVLGGIVRIAVATGAIALKQFHSSHQVFFRGRNRVGIYASGA